LYTPRNLYVLFNLVLKAEDLFAGSPVHDSLRLALLQCLELGSKLNAIPGEPASRRAPRLRPPARFAEWNIWQLFEDATRELAQRQPASPVPLAANVSDRTGEGFCRAHVCSAAGIRAPAGKREPGPDSATSARSHALGAALPVDRMALRTRRIGLVVADGQTTQL
jgi:hypothetical protein